MDPFETIRAEIIHDPLNQAYQNQGFEPLYLANAHARIVIVGQAPGIKTQLAGKAWNDASGDRLRSWLGVNEATFYSPLFAQLPMDFYYPGKAKTGDLPPRKGFAQTWHPKLLALMPEVELFILAGLSAQRYYLGEKRQANLTENVRHYADYLPQFFPIVHPSPLNFRWHLKNAWFGEEVLPVLQARVHSIITKTT